MFTRCPGCHTVHPVNAGLLAQGSGKFRCGKCNKVNNALECLFDEWPDAGQQPASAGQVPVLGINLSTDAAEEGEAKAGAAGDPAVESTAPGRNRLRWAWISAALVLAIVTAINLVRFFDLGEPAVSTVDKAMVKLGLKESAAVESFRDLAGIELVSRDMRSHPTLRDALRLSATIVNRAPRVQAFPKLEVILLDSRGEALARRVFRPSEYLLEGADAESGMAPDAYLPISLDLADPGRQAVGFELEFR